MQMTLVVGHDWKKILMGPVEILVILQQQKKIKNVTRCLKGKKGRKRTKAKRTVI